MVWQKRSRSVPRSRSLARICRLCLLGLVLLATTAIGAAAPESSDWTLIPLGRSAIDGPNSVEVVVGGTALSVRPISDGCGGYWLRVPDVASEDTTISLRFTVAKDHMPAEYTGRSEDQWLAPSPLIDSDHPSIVALAATAAPSHSTKIERASALHDSVSEAVRWHNYSG